MDERALRLEKGHLYVEVDGEWWLIDTGSPVSFGLRDRVEIGGVAFPVAAQAMGLDAARLSGFAGRETAGLLGTDVWNRFDVELDLIAGRLRIGPEIGGSWGAPIPMTYVGGVPVVHAEMGGARRRVFFDTGAQVSYWHSEELSRFRGEGMFEDFLPSFGVFEVAVHRVPVALGGVGQEIRCGALPDAVQRLLPMTGVDGILGNEILEGRRALYRGPRSELCFSGRG